GSRPTAPRSRRPPPRAVGAPVSGRPASSPGGGRRGDRLLPRPRSASGPRRGALPAPEADAPALLRWSGPRWPASARSKAGRGSRPAAPDVLRFTSIGTEAGDDRCARAARGAARRRPRGGPRAGRRARTARGPGVGLGAAAGGRAGVRVPLPAGAGGGGVLRRPGRDRVLPGGLRRDRGLGGVPAGAGDHGAAGRGGDRRVPAAGV